MSAKRTIPNRLRRAVMNTAALVIAIGLVSACASAPQRNPVPESLVDSAVVSGLEDVRYWGDGNPPELEHWLSEGRWHETEGTDHYFLALSGGGANGAFGAGLLNGWTEAGTRPTFNVVTGISTGALIAPFAFLGPEYDDELKRLFTELSTKDLIEKRGKLAVLEKDAAADTAPLRAKIAEVFDQEFIEAIAAEYRKGRILNIGTTNLDTERPVIWSIGRIAASGAPNALDLIHDVILASTSIGGAFPPVMIEVEANGQSYDEMHVDGGTANQVFVYPLRLDWAEVRAKLDIKKVELYVIRNAILAPSYDAVERRTIPIGLRSVSSLIRTQGVGDLDRIYLEAERDGLNFHLAYIPDDFNAKSTEPFDPVYMKKLFEVGYNLAKNGYPWQRTPPGYGQRKTD